MDDDTIDYTIKESDTKRGKKSGEPEMNYNINYFTDIINYIKDLKNKLKSSNNSDVIDKDELYPKITRLMQMYKNMKSEDWPSVKGLEDEYTQALLELETEMYPEISHLLTTNIFDEQIDITPEICKINQKNCIGKVLDFADKRLVRVDNNASVVCDVKINKQIIMFVRNLYWRFCQQHIREIVKRFDCPKNDYTKLIIITASTTDQLDIQNWFNIVVTFHQDKVDMYIDDKKILFSKVGFNWNLPFSNTYTIHVIKGYAKMFKQDEKRRKLNQSFDPQDQDFVYRHYLPKEQNAQQAGDVILDGDFKILSVFPMKYYNDRPRLETLGI